MTPPRPAPPRGPEKVDVLGIPVAIDRMVNALAPYDRAARLRILCAVATLHGHYGLARHCLDELERT
jgi:hypothetical protein